MGRRPRERLDQLGTVMQQMTNQKNVWNWKKFKIAVQNLGCMSHLFISSLFLPHQKRYFLLFSPVHVASCVRHTRFRCPNLHCSVHLVAAPTANPKAKTANPPITERPMPKKQGSWWVIAKADSSCEHEKEKAGSSASSVTEVIVGKTKTSSPPLTPAVTPVDAGMCPATLHDHFQFSSPSLFLGSLTTVSKAPAWMVNACQALDFLTSEHPKAMSAMSAILLTIGAIPSIPAISAGAGGAFLASSAVQAAGAVAMGVGQALKAMQDGQVKVDTGASA